jgi:activator of HSP90 ATPase
VAKITDLLFSASESITFKAISLFADMKDFKKYFVITAKPDQVYLALTTEATIQLWSGDKTEMKAEPDTEFSLWDGSIVGKNLEFEPGKKIVQQWYFGEETEPSIVTIKLHPHDQGTSVEVRQTNIPDEEYEDIAEGWTHAYMGALQEFYEGEPEE